MRIFLRTTPPEEAARATIETLLLEYAAGSLDEAGSLLMASFLTLNPEARRLTAVCEDLGAALMEHACPPVSLSAGGFEKVRARLSEPPPPSEPSGPAPESEEGEKIPGPLRQFLEEQGEGAWQGTEKENRGIQVLPLPVRTNAARLRLMRFSPASGLPPHRHEGTELMLVLSGGLKAGRQDYHRGDMLVIERRVRHETRADAAEGCLCLEFRMSAPRERGIADWVRDFFA